MPAMPSDLTVRIWTRLARAQRDVLGTIEAALKAACEKLLANTVIENYRVELQA